MGPDIRMSMVSMLVKVSIILGRSSKISFIAGLKALAVFRRFTHNDTLVDITKKGVDWTFQYHGAASGGILADERLAGLAPYYGYVYCIHTT